jgi:pimeloyl-ACP methyl ester carboxylesterase
MTPPRSAREIAAALKATVHSVPAGHALMQESPDDVLNAMRKALA